MKQSVKHGMPWYPAGSRLNIMPMVYQKLQSVVQLGLPWCCCHVVMQ
jgi:hypothetical protein